MKSVTVLSRKMHSNAYCYCVKRSQLVNMPLMNAQLAEDRDIALALHRLLSDIDGKKFRLEMERRFHSLLADVENKVKRSARHEVLLQKIDESKGVLDSDDTGVKSRWLKLKQRLLPAYGQLEEQLKAESVHVPTLRPTNYTRSLFHVASGAFALFMLEFFSFNKLIVIGVAGAWFVYAWSCEIARRFSPAFNQKLMKLYSSVAHPHEAKKINSATWYSTALLLISLTQSTMWGVAGVVVLAVGDPLAAFIGRRYGHIRLLNGRSLEGSVAFIVSAALSLFAALFIFHRSEINISSLVFVSIVSAVFGAVAELLSLRVDDNFSIPMSAAAGAALALLVIS
jgi:dolichol kinase